MITLKRATPEAVRYACLNFHYARQVPICILSYNVYNDASEWCGVIIFSNGSLTFAKSLGLKNGEFLELARVALNGKQSCTSECVAAAMRKVHKDMPQIKALVSFADTAQNHYGTIYQATNWIYLGESAGAKYFIIKGRKMHAKSVGSCGWKENIDWIHEHVDPNAELAGMAPKRKYVHFYDKKLRKEWQKKALPYPKKLCDSSSTAEQPAHLRGDGGSTPTLTLQ